MDTTKKTADLKEYQRQYRLAHPKDKAKTNEYMKEYIKDAEDIQCKVCDGKYKDYSKQSISNTFSEYKHTYILYNNNTHIQIRKN
jgi:hypothetical protein